MVSGPIDLGSVEEDGSIRITSEQLLVNSTDADGDSLAVVDLKLDSGKGTILDNDDGSCYYESHHNFFPFSTAGLKSDFGGT